MPATLEDALSNAIAVLQDAGESRRMPSGVPLDAEATTFMLDCAFELEDLRARMRAEAAARADSVRPALSREEQLIEQA